MSSFTSDEALNTCCWNFESAHSNTISHFMNIEKQKNHTQSMRFSTSENISGVCSTGTIAARTSSNNTMRNGYSFFNAFNKIKPPDIRHNTKPANITHYHRLSPHPYPLSRNSLSPPTLLNNYKSLM